MATRLYPNRDWYTDWLSDTLTLKGGWTGSSNLTRLHFSPVKENEGTSSRGGPSGVSAPYAGALLFGMSPRLQAQTLGGTVNPLVFVSEGNAAWDCAFRLHLWVSVGDTNAVRGTLLNQFEDTAEFPTSFTAARCSAAPTLTSVAAQDGDRIVIELGFIQRAAGSGSFGVFTYIGTNYQTPDATVGATTPTASNGFIEFSADLLFKPGLSNEACAGATVVSAFPYTQTVNTTNGAVVAVPNQYGDCSDWGDDTLPVWWKATGIPAGRELQVSLQGSTYGTVVTIWTGSCAALTEQNCAVSPTNASPLRWGPTTGIDYYVLVQRDVAVEGTGPGGPITIALSVVTPAAHGCTLALPILAIPYQVTDLNTAAVTTADVAPSLTCCSTQVHMQWFSYTPATSHRLYLNAQGTTYAHAIGLFTGACPGGPWTQLACRAGSPLAAAQLSVPVTAGTHYWIVVAADDNPAGLLTLQVGDTVALGFIQAGEPGAVEWEGNYNYFDCNGAPCFLQILAPTGSILIALRLYGEAACWVGDTFMIGIDRLVVLAGAPLPEIPLTAFPAPPPCAAIGMGTTYGHLDQAANPTPWVGTFKLRFKLSSRDTISGASLGDAYVEVSWSGSTFGTYRYDNLTIVGSVWQGFAFHPGFWTDRVYLRKLDVYSGWDPRASNLVWYRDFTATPATNAEMFEEAGGLFYRMIHGFCATINPAHPLPGAPRLDALGRPTYYEAGNASVSCFCGLRRVGAFPPYLAPPAPPDLSVLKTQVGDFIAGGQGFYAVTVTNAGGEPTTGLVTVGDVLPTGLTPIACYGPGWTTSLSPLQATRSDPLGPGASYPPLTIVVAVSTTAPPSVTNTVTVTGGGDPTPGTGIVTTPILPPLSVVCPTGATFPVDDVTRALRRTRIRRPAEPPPTARAEPPAQSKSLIFSSDFEDGSTGWTYAGPATSFAYLGCGGSICLACGQPSALQLMQQFAGEHYTTGTIRLQFAYAVADPTNPVSTSAYIISGITADEGGIPLIQVFAYPDGHVQVEAIASTLSTAPGVVPTNGTFVAVQFAWTLYVEPSVPFPGFHDLFADLTLVINNVVVGNWTHAIVATNDYGVAPRAAYWNDVRFMAWTADHGTSHVVNFAVDNVEVDNTVNILSRLPCAARPLTPEGCYISPTPVITGLAVDCSTNQLLVTGGPFLHPIVQLTGPDGRMWEWETWEKGPITETLMVLQLYAPLVDGEYCVTAHNYPTSSDSTFCATLTCAGGSCPASLLP